MWPVTSRLNQKQDECAYRQAENVTKPQFKVDIVYTCEMWKDLELIAAIPLE